VTRSVPLVRRLRALRGKILLGGAWVLAALACLVLAQLQPGGVASVGVATQRVHPVLAPESGRLVSVTVTPGQAVAAGDELARIEVPGLTALIAASEAELRAEIELGASDVADRGRRFSRDVEDNRARLAESERALAEERAMLGAAQAELDRATKPGVALSELEVATLRARAAALEASVNGRQRARDALSSALGSARSRESAFAAVGLPVQAERLQAERDALIALREALVLRAPTDGVVAFAPGEGVGGERARMVPVPGQWVTGGLPVLSVAEVGTNEAVVFVDASRVRAIAPGATVRLRPASGGVSDGVVHTIGAGVEQLPLRQAHDPAVPEWGVPVTVRVGSRVLLPGEQVAVEF
jgi:multidrug efflux pump subunit AcrA (membrane-fusion protein)